ncbi:hypothetical protein B0H63DRAFT_196041 [Podospora didyma]|uniref:Ankyrin repeat protein n=1 Tax=Podospora didyma TaxID=330526 RepID=A0AAE0TVL3_9PEZI|nr:hypothetical protein B0H63DRAFT_196041 [Podospora didyma]
MLYVSARCGWTPLHYACQFGFFDQHRQQAAAARVLLDKRADIQARTNSGWTPLMIAVQTTVALAFRPPPCLVGGSMTSLLKEVAVLCPDIFETAPIICEAQPARLMVPYHLHRRQDNGYKLKIFRYLFAMLLLPLETSKKKKTRHLS